jgi:uncharacterized protein YndB with AHSA1/START domain
VPLCEIDARPGGVIRFQHRWPEGPLVSIRGVFDEAVAPTRLSFTFTFVDSNDRPTVNAMMPEWPVGAHIVMTVELVATARGTRMTVAQRVAEPELADSAPIVRHRKLAAISWSQTAEHLVAYLERRTPAPPPLRSLRSGGLPDAQPVEKIIPERAALHRGCTTSHAEALGIDGHCVGSGGSRPEGERGEQGGAEHEASHRFSFQ